MNFKKSSFSSIALGLALLVSGGMSAATNTRVSVFSGKPSSITRNVVVNDTCESLYMVNSQQLAVKKFYAEDITYVRTSATHWNSLCLPFDAQAVEGDGVQLYNVISVGEDALVLSETDVLKAGTPGIAYTQDAKNFKVKGSGYVDATEPVFEGSNIIVGSFSNNIIPGSDTSNKYFGISAATDDVINVPVDAPISAYRCYWKLATASAQPMSLAFAANEEEDATDVKVAAASDAKVEGIFTIDGKQIKKIQKGTNIIRMSDGSSKKVIVK